jgi:hypothetical protein
MESPWISDGVHGSPQRVHGNVWGSVKSLNTEASQPPPPNDVST